MVQSRHSRRIVPISRSTNGCESGTYGTVLIASTSRIRRFACHWWNRYKRIMVRAEVCRRGVAARRSIDHPTQPHAIHDAAMHAKAHDAPRTLVHHAEHPVRAQYSRFASKQIKTPQAVLRVTKDREPGRPRRVWFRLVPSGENAPHHVLVDGDTEGQRDRL